MLEQYIAAKVRYYKNTTLISTIQGKEGDTR